MRVEANKLLTAVSKASKEGKELVKSIRVLDEVNADLKQRLTKSKKIHEKLSNQRKEDDLYAVILDNWLFFVFVLFLQVISYVGADYLWNLHPRATLHALLRTLTFEYYFIFPILAFGVWLVMMRGLLTSKKKLQMLVMLAGFAMIFLSCADLIIFTLT